MFGPNSITDRTSTMIESRGRVVDLEQCCAGLLTASELELLCALGGIRTPNLLIRRFPRRVDRRRGMSSDLDCCSAGVGRCRLASVSLAAKLAAERGPLRRMATSI